MGRSIRPGAAGGHELWLVREVGVAADEISGAVEDGLVGAPVVGQRQAPAREPRANVFDLGVTQRLVAQPVLVGAVDGEQHLDRLELRTTGVWTFRTIGGRTRAPLPLVDLERALAETLGTDAAALELEQEAKARTQQVIEVVDRE